MNDPAGGAPSDATVIFRSPLPEGPFTNALTGALVAANATLTSELEALYKYLHQHPELSMQEVRTAKIAARSHLW